MTRTNLSTAEKLITRYPWYTLGYVDVYEEICRIDPDSTGIYLSKAAARVYSREYLYDFSRQHNASADKGDINQHRSDEVIDQDRVGEESFLEERSKEEVIDGDNRDEEIAGDEEVVLESGKSGKTGMSEIELDEIDFLTDDMPKFVLAGGDYFSRKELDQLELDKDKPLDHFIAEKPTLLRGAVQGNKPIVKDDDEVDVSDFFNDASFYTETLANIYTEQGFHKRAIDVYAKLILLYPEKSSYFASLVSKLKEKYNI